MRNTWLKVCFIICDYNTIFYRIYPNNCTRKSTTYCCALLQLIQYCFNVACNAGQRQINVETTCCMATLEFKTLKEAYSEPCKIPDVELFAKLVNK